MLALTLALTGGCALRPTTPILGDAERAREWQQHVTAITALERWAATGRVSVRQGRQGWNAALHWTQAAADFRLRIMAPLAQGTWQIEGNSRSVAMTTPQQEYLLAADVETLLQTQLGWTLPVGGARYWLTGIPDPDRAYDQLQLNDEGLLELLAQGGWLIRVQEYQSVGGYRLPRRLTLERDEVTVRLALTQWQMDAGH